MNKDNLKKGNPDTYFKSGREAVENGRKGGIRSGESKKEMKAAREMMQELLRRYDEGEQMTEQEKMLCHNLRIAQGKAKGDAIAASKFVLELADEYKQTTRTEIDARIPSREDIIKLMDKDAD